MPRALGSDGCAVALGVTEASDSRVSGSFSLSDGSKGHAAEDAAPRGATLEGDHPAAAAEGNARDRTPPDDLPIGDYGLWWHFEKLRRSFHRRGGRCRRCWHAARVCVCARLADTIAPPRCVAVPGAPPSDSRGKIELVVLFHYEEVGRASNTAKLAVYYGGAVGYIAGLRDSHIASGTVLADSIPPGLGTEDAFMKATAAPGRRFVLFPSADAVSVDEALWSPARAADGDAGCLQPSTTGGARLAALEGEHRAALAAVASISVRLWQLNAAVAAAEEVATVRLGHHERLTAAPPHSTTAVQTDMARRLLALTDPAGSCTPGSRADGGSDGAAATFIVLDGTYRQAKHLNARVVPPRYPRVKIQPAGSSLYRSRRLSAQRALDGRISTIEALLALVLSVDPGFELGGDPTTHQAWRHSLRCMVDAVKLQRGQPAAFHFGEAIRDATTFSDDSNQSHGAMVQRPPCCLQCGASGGFRNLGALPGRPEGSRLRVWRCKRCKEKFSVNDPD